MSQACISYGSLKNASSEAKHVANKLNKYVDNLNSQVCKKLSEYSGDCTSNIEQINKQISSKITDLQNRAEAYMEYSQDLLDLKEQCATTDKAVRSRVSELTASFKSNNGIKDSNVQNSINYFLTSVGNRSSCRRWLSDKKDEFRASKKYVLQRIEDWWGYEGGAQFIKGIVVGSMEVIIATCTIVCTVLSGGALLVVIAGLVVGIIALSNGVANLYNEVVAYNVTKDGDPSTGRRRRGINTWQDYLRSSFIYDDKGIVYNKDNYNNSWNVLATGIDVVNFVCTTVTVIDGIGSFVKNVYKWTTGSMSDVKNLRVKDIFTKENFSMFKNRIKTTVSTGFSDIKCAFKTKNFKSVKEWLFDFGDDFLNNLKNGYTFNIFSEDKNAKSFIKHGAKLIKNYSSIVKTAFSDGDLVKNICGTIVLKRIVLNNINIADIVTYKGGEGVFAYDFDSIKLTDPTGKLKDMIDIASDFSELVKKFANKSNISVQVPDIQIPDVLGINCVYM